MTVRIDPNTGLKETIVDQDVIMEAITKLYGSGTTANIKMTSRKPWKKDKGGQRAIGMAVGAAMIA